MGRQGNYTIPRERAPESQYNRQRRRHHSHWGRSGSDSFSDRSWSRDEIDERKRVDRRMQRQQYRNNNKIASRRDIAVEDFSHKCGPLLEDSNTKRHKRRRYRESSSRSSNETYLYSSRHRLRQQFDEHNRSDTSEVGMIKDHREDHQRSVKYKGRSISHNHDFGTSFSSSASSQTFSQCDRFSPHGKNGNDKKSWFAHRESDSDIHLKDKSQKASADVLQELEQVGFLGFSKSEEVEKQSKRLFNRHYPSSFQSGSCALPCSSIRCESTYDKEKEEAFRHSPKKETTDAASASFLSYHVALCGVDLTVTADHIQSVIEQLTGSVSQRVHRPALKTLCSSIQSIPGVSKFFLSHTKKDTQHNGIPATSGSCSSSTCGVSEVNDVHNSFQTCFCLVPSPSEEIVLQTVQSLDPNSFGGIVMLEFDDAGVASEVVTLLNGAKINGRAVAASLLSGHR